MVYIVTIDGIIGCGKSSLIAQLSDTYTCFQEPLADWSLLPSFYSDMPKYAAMFQFQVLFSYHKLYSAFKNINDTVVIERSPFTSNRVFTEMLVEKGLVSDPELRVYRSFFDQLEFPINLFIYLKVDPDVAYTRIKQRDRAAEKDLRYDYLVQLNEKYTAEMDRLALDRRVLCVDANRPVEDIKRDVLRVLANSPL